MKLMHSLKNRSKRILTDAAGYLLILAGIATGWLPGPGGIPLIVGGLGLLSINNLWAKRLRMWVVENGSKATQIIFPKHPAAEWGYDALVVLLFALTIVLEVRHANAIEMGLGVTAFFVALFIALTNRDRLKRLRGNA
jgi:hypothetical protein